MKTIEVKVYSFSELSDCSQENALKDLWDINHDYDWYAQVYEDAENAGIKITAFDIDTMTIKGKFINGSDDVCERIKKEHGKETETYKIVNEFIKSYSKLIKTNLNEDNYCDELDFLKSGLLNKILGAYLKMLKEDYEYRESKQAIIETIEANEYDFTIDGSLFTLKANKVN